MNQIAGTWNAPMDSSGRDPVVGRTEWGAPIYRSALGHTYWREPKKPGYEKNALKLRDMMAMHGDGPRKPMEYETTRQAPDGVSQPTLGGAMGGIRDMIMSGLSAPRRAMEGQPVTNGEVMNAALDWGMMAAPMSAPKGALRAGGMADDAPKGIKAYHGSPHDFDRFSMDKIGTGEGAQAYGHGLYFADSEDVARSYRDALALDSGFSYKGQSGLTRDQLAEAIAAEYGGKYLDNVTTPRGVADSVMDELIYGPSTRKLGPERAKLRERLLAEISRTDPGKMYEVNINANPDDFLDWDAPISDAPKQFQDWVKSRMDEVDLREGSRAQRTLQAWRGGPNDWRPAEGANVPTPRVAEVRNWLGDYGEKQAGMTEALRAAGIPGIKYLDAGSRGAGAGTRNYVVFDENLISILRKYGIGAMVPGAGYMLNDDEYSSVEALQ